MTLKPDRDVEIYDVTKFMISTTGVAGGVVSATGATPSGAAMDQTGNTVWYAPNASGATPVGLLLNNVVNVDLTRQILNPFQSEVQLGDKVTLAVLGSVTTNFIEPGSPAITTNAPAYLAGSGYLTVSSGYGGGPNDFLRPRVGTFRTKKDDDGFASLFVRLPN